MSWMTKHTKNLLGDMPIDDKASALNHNSFPVHKHPHSAITANPGGVVTTCSLGNDQAAATAALPNGAQMFWGTAVFA